MQLSNTSVNCLLLHFLISAYKVQIVSSKPKFWIASYDFALEMFFIIGEGNSYLRWALFSVHALFYLNCLVKKHNGRVYGTTNPYVEINTTKPSWKWIKLFGNMFSYETTICRHWYYEIMYSVRNRRAFVQRVKFIMVFQQNVGVRKSFIIP